MMPPCPLLPSLDSRFSVHPLHRENQGKSEAAGRTDRSPPSRRRRLWRRRRWGWRCHRRRPTGACAGAAAALPSHSISRPPPSPSSPQSREVLTPRLPVFLLGRWFLQWMDGVTVKWCAGSESTVYEARLGGERVAAKKPVLATSEDLDKFHYQLQLLWSVSCSLSHNVLFIYRVPI